MHHDGDSARDLVILGAGGFAREIAWLVRHVNRSGMATWNTLGFWSHDPGQIGMTINGLPVVDPRRVTGRAGEVYAVAAIGDPRARERAVDEAVRAGCRFATLVHPSVLLDELTVTVGPGSVICAGCILTTNIAIGSHVIVNLDCTIGHDCVIEDFATLSPGCHLSGHTTVRRGAYLGTGLVTVEQHEIGRDATVGAQAAVVKDIGAGITAIGVPARPKGAS
jgi:sugar O-acyltransferase (sialic acid O-acetyltransferase NeuD family)